MQLTREVGAGVKNKCRMCIFTALERRNDVMREPVFGSLGEKLPDTSDDVKKKPA